MSSSSGFSQVSSQRSAPNSPEKRSFAPGACLLGKERLVSRRDMNLGFLSNLRRGNGSTPEIFHRPEKMGNLKSLDLFPQKAGFGLSLPNEVDARVCKSAVAAPQPSQMTIFYAGQVFVFNNFPVDRAGEVMLLASRERSKLNNNPFSSNLGAGQTVLVGSPADSISSSSPSSTTHISIFEEKKKAQKQSQTPPLPQPVPCALPIARKASIQRFLEKRKDRLTARAPYQSCPSKLAGAGDNSWLGLAVQPQH